METFAALVARRNDDRIDCAVETMEESELPPGEVTVRVAYSSVNFKDALAVTPNGGVVRDYPIVPGIDLTGEVVDSQSPDFAVGDAVLAHGYEIGTGPQRRLRRIRTAARGLGGLAGLVEPPRRCGHRNGGLHRGDERAGADGPRHHARRRADRRDRRDRWVGSVSIDLLAAAGYEVVASTGKPDAAERLKALGAADVIGRLPEDPDAKPRPLGKTRWAGAVDCVGGKTLADVLSTIRYGGAVAASGLTGGAALNTTVMPFILRGVALLGIDSVLMPIGPRRELWEKLGGSLRPQHLSDISRDVDVKDVVGVLDEIHAGRYSGRAVVRVAGGF